MNDNKSLEELNSQRNLYKSVLSRVKWCCEGRHGVIWNVEKKDEQLVLKAITYFFGNKGQWWKKNGMKTYDVEFVPMTKVFPPPKRPWKWCGKTVLFQEWQQREEEDDAKANIYRKFLGKKASFAFKEETIIGTLINTGKRASLLTENGKKWYVPYDDLTVI